MFVPARIAAGLGRALNLDAYRVSVRGRDSELDAVLLAWHSTALQWVDDCRDQARFRMDGTGLDDRRNLADRWGTSEVAARTGCGSRAVTKAASEGRLVGEFIAGRWQFKVEEVAQWAARKRGAR